MCVVRTQKDAEDDVFAPSDRRVVHVLSYMCDKIPSMGFLFLRHLEEFAAADEAARGMLFQSSSHAAVLSLVDDLHPRFQVHWDCVIN